MDSPTFCNDCGGGSWDQSLFVEEGNHYVHADVRNCVREVKDRLDRLDGGDDE